MFYNSGCFHFIQKVMNILMVLFAFVPVINGYKILFLSPHNAKSHQIYMQSFVKALLNRGHHVTFLKSAPFYWSNGANYTEILVDPPFDTDTIRKIFHSILLKLNEIVKKIIFFCILGRQEDLFQASPSSSFAYIKKLPTLGILSSNHSLSTKNVQKLINQKDQHFDLIIIEEFYHDCYLMFGYIFKAPMIKIGKSFDWVLIVLGSSEMIPNCGLIRI